MSIVAVIAALGAVWAAPSTAHRELDRQKSRLEFHAVSFLHSFDGKVAELEGEASIGGALESAKGKLSIVVASIKTGIGKRDQELLKTLEYQKYPRIEFVLKSVKPLANVTEDGRVIDALAAGESKCALSGELKIKGRSAPVEARGVCRRLNGGAWRVEGEAPVDLREFAIETPRVPFIKLAPVVTVRYDLIYK